MRVRHPDGDDYVTVHGTRVPVADDGTFPIPDEHAESFLERWCARNGYDREEVRTDAESDASADSAGDTSHESDGDETPTCAGSTADGSPCTREVESPGDYCYQHEED